MKPWDEMTEKEIIRLKRNQCIKCKYFTRISTDSIAGGHMRLHRDCRTSAWLLSAGVRGKRNLQEKREKPCEEKERDSSVKRNIRTARTDEKIRI